ncbi:MAG: DUF1849 family protein [Rhodospirillales bacterium]
MQSANDSHGLPEGPTEGRFAAFRRTAGVDTAAENGVLWPQKPAMLTGTGLVMRRLFLLLIATASIGLQPRTARTLELQPHRAVYRMVLASASPSSDLVSANGVMVYRFDRGCDGWTVENRTFLRLFYDDDTVSDTLWSFVSWESLDSRKFRFHARYDQDGKTVELLEGDADLHGPGKAGKARFSQPGQEVRLPAGTVFPTKHLQEVIAAAAAGGHRLKSIVFDGASIDNPYVVSSLFGAVAPAAAQAMATQLHLPLAPAWKAQMAFFPLNSRDAAPQLEMTGEYRADGIADALIQHFDAFSLDIRLREIQLLTPPDC